MGAGSDRTSGTRAVIITDASFCRRYSLEPGIGDASRYQRSSDIAIAARRSSLPDDAHRVRSDLRGGGLPVGTRSNASPPMVSATSRTARLSQDGRRRASAPAAPRGSGQTELAGTRRGRGVALHVPISSARLPHS